jgi:hypothetical protein
MWRAFAILLLLPFPAFAGSWPDMSYSEVRGYGYNHKWPIIDSKGRQLIAAPLVDDGKLGSSVVNKSGARLNPEQIQRVIRAITGEHPAHLTARCWKPHHGFVFYNAQGKAVAWVEICFECGYARASPEIPDHSYDDMDSLWKLTEELKLPSPPKGKI